QGGRPEEGGEQDTLCRSPRRRGAVEERIRVLSVSPCVRLMPHSEFVKFAGPYRPISHGQVLEVWNCGGKSLPRPRGAESLRASLLALRIIGLPIRNGTILVAKDFFFTPRAVRSVLKNGRLLRPFVKRVKAIPAAEKVSHRAIAKTILLINLVRVHQMRQGLPLILRRFS